MKLALSGFLFEDNYLAQSLDLPAFFDLARAAGYHGVELRDTQIKPDAPLTLKQEVRRLARATQLAIVCLTARHLPGAGPQRDAYFRQYLELCQALGCRLLKITADAAWLRHAAGQAQAGGVTLAANNHVGGRLETIAGTRDYFAEIQHPNMGLLFDAMHLSLAQQDYLGFIPECLPLTRNILIHSLRPAQPGETVLLERGGEKWTPALPDETGVQPDWAGVLSRFKALGYAEWVTVIESNWPAARREYVARHCAKTIARLWNNAPAANAKGPA